MMYDHVSVQDIVDSECAHEFLMEASKLASSAELEDTGYRLECKSVFFTEWLAPEALNKLDEKGLQDVLGLVFFLRRGKKKFIATHGVERLRGEIAALLYGEQAIALRLEQFCTVLHGCERANAMGLASELLHFTRPQEYWLWTKWIWDSQTAAGALPLVLRQNIDLKGESLGETYAKVGRAMAMVTAAGHAEGFARLAPGMFGTDIFLACVYAIYMHTVFRMRLSEEFNRILPQLPEFTRRILGIHKMVV